MSIGLEEKGELKPMSSSAGGASEKKEELLSRIVEEINEQFGTEFTEDDRVFLGRVASNLLDNEDLLGAIEHNPPRQVKATFPTYFESEFAQILENDADLYKKLDSDEELKKGVMEMIFELMYAKYEKRKKLKNSENDDRTEE